MFSPQFFAEPMMFDSQYPGKCSDLANLKERVKKSYIIKEKYRPATTTAVYDTVRLPPRILKRGWLESSGPKLVSSLGKTKKIAFLFSNFFSLNYFF